MWYCIIQIILLYLCPVEYLKECEKKCCRYANEQSRKSRHVKHVHTSRGQHKRAVPCRALHHSHIFFSLCITVKQRERSERFVPPNLSFPAPAARFSRGFAISQASGVGHLRDPDRFRSRSVSGVPIDLLVACSDRATRHSPSFSPFHFPGCPFTRAHTAAAHRPSNRSRARAHSRLRYRARALRRSDP